MSWQLSLMLAIILLAVIFLMNPVSRAFRKLDAWRMIHSGRSIEWPEALRRVRNGDGYIIDNRSSLPGRVLWVQANDNVNEAELHHIVHERGLIVTSIEPERVRGILTVEGLQERLRQLNCDPLATPGSHDTTPGSGLKYQISLLPTATGSARRGIKGGE